MQKWLREKHNIHVEIYVFADKYDVNVIEYKNNECIYQYEGVKYKTYEEALEIGLQQALKLIK